jgi:hypothetical protein
MEPHFANATVLNMSTLGMTDACVDSRTMALGFPEFARNNTYGIEIYSEEVAEAIIANMTALELGCHALIDQCRAVAEQGDPMGTGTNATFNAACSVASEVCFVLIQGDFGTSTGVSSEAIDDLRGRIEPVLTISFSLAISFRRDTIESHTYSSFLSPCFIQSALGAGRPRGAIELYCQLVAPPNVVSARDR